MNIRELFSLLNWIDEHVKKPDIVAHYLMVQEILQRHSQPNQPKQPFFLEKVGLIKALEEIPLNKLIDEQIMYLDKLGILSNIGEPAIAGIKNILTDNALDPATAANKIGEMSATLSDGLERSENLRTNLECLVSPRKESERETIVRINFEGNSQINNLVDLRTWANSWYDIAYGIARFNNMAPENIRVIGADHDPLIIELAMNQNYAIQILDILYGALKSMEKIYNLRFYQEHISRQNVKKVTTVMIKEQLEEEIDSEKEESVEKIFKDIVKEFAVPEGEGDRAIHLRRCIKNLMDFMDKGGRVDIIPPFVGEVDDYGNLDPKLRRLVQRTEDLRQLDREVKSLVSDVSVMNEGKRPWLTR